MSVEAVQLAQARYNDTSNHALVTVAAAGGTIQVTRLVICNTTGSAATCRVFHDTDGTTYDQTTALRYDKSVAANDVHEIQASSEDDGIFISPGGNLAVQNGTANALTFTAYGHRRGPR